ncbi:HAD family hydrolase [Corynebacterium breve]|uniref:HAD family hydrolase n=1 Tax=Corynebacterium breve TaxID=3049799 RepID=A0ABY8VER3_9CORY|nr:HAD family hydrolase [Corynebacterium breve]WIM67827.1 HAD family hydrolase [Corynebacterium breve]
MTQLPRPRAILLDFGGVVFTTSKRSSGRQELAEEMVQALRKAGFELASEDVLHSVDTGLSALKDWKNAASRRRFPRDLGPRELIVDFLAADLPDGPRELLASESRHWLARKNVLTNDHFVRPGIVELLDRCRAEGIALGIVSNAQSGYSHRQLLAEHGLADYFDVQIYSDEVGIRKPHPGMITLAADALGLTPAECWYVGDTFDRDVVAGRRAGAGGVIITRDTRTSTPPFAIRDTPDVTLDDPSGILSLLDDVTVPVSDLIEEQEQNTKEALLIDHGGVISASRKDSVGRGKFVEDLAGWLVVDKLVAERIVNRALAANAERKRSDLEATAAEFWAAGVEGEEPRIAALVRSEAYALSEAWGKAKSARQMRDGIVQLFDYCRDEGISIIVVTNTVSGQAVRHYLRTYGLWDYITAVVASDEIGVRKPHPGIVEAALAVSGSDPGHTWFLGDKPENDAAGARACGIAHRVLVKLDPPTEEQSAAVDAALSAGLATEVIDSPAELITLIRNNRSTE